MKLGPAPASAARGFNESVITFYVFFLDEVEMKVDLCFVYPGGIFQEEKFFKIENRFALDKTLLKPILKFGIRIISAFNLPFPFYSQFLPPQEFLQLALNPQRPYPIHQYDL